MANRFAAAFLMPDELAIDEFKRRDGKEIESAPMGIWLDMKRRFGCSIAALIVRCHELGVLDKDAYTRNWIRLGYLGWGKHEPDVELNVPQYGRFADLCYEGWQRGLITRSKLNELLGGALDLDEIPLSQ